MTRPTMFCESCESTVSTDDVHSCYDAKAVREQQERERKLAALERAVVEAARQMVTDITKAVERRGLMPMIAHDGIVSVAYYDADLGAAVRALDAEEGAP